MVDHITPERIANSIMQNSNFRGVYLIVEGQSDIYFYKKFVDSDICNFKMAFGSENVIDVVDILNQRGYQDKLGLIDSDFRNITGVKVGISNVLQTDFHDIEMLIFGSPAFYEVLEMHFQEEKCRRFEGETQNDICNIILTLAKPIGCLKLINIKYNINLIFKNKKLSGNQLNYSRFIDAKTLEFYGPDVMIKTVRDYSVNKTKSILSSVEEIIDIYNSEIENDYDLYQLCNGHDISNIIAISLRSKIGSNNSRDCRFDIIEKELILAYNPDFFRQTKLYSNIKVWESDNVQILNI